jgi:hypothetical protein
MGCWNGTCLLSNLPIMHGEPIVGFTIEYAHFSDEADYSGSCYPEAWARPIGLPLYGEYDDYGGIEKVEENIAVKYLLHLFNQKDIGKLTADIERDDVKIVSNITNKKVGVGLVMAHRDIADKIVNSCNVDEYGVSLAKVAEGLKKLYEMQKDKKISNMANLCADTIVGIKCDILESKNYIDMVNFVLSLSDKYDEKLSKEWVDLLNYNHSMRVKMYELRKLWIGPAGKGSQSVRYKSHLLLANATKDHIFKSVCRNNDEDMSEAYNFFLTEHDSY